MPEITDCLFCRMNSGKFAVTVVAENEHAFAIRDIHPRAPVHVLIVPRVHISSAKDVDDSHGPVLAGMVRLSQQIARQEGVFDSGYRLAFNVGEAAGMTIWHLHLHLLAGRALGPEG